MTPLASKVANELTLPLKRRTFDDTANVLSLFDQEMHCFEVSAISKSVNAVLDDPIAAKDSNGAWEVWDDIASMLPRMFLPSPVTWLEQVFEGRRIACVLQERGGGVFSLIVVYDSGSIDMCKFRARSVLEPGDRVDVFDIHDEEEETPASFDLTKVVRGVDLKNPTPEQRHAIIAGCKMAELRMRDHERKVDRLSKIVDFLGAAHRFIGMCVLALDLINTPGLIGLKQRDINRGLVRKLNRAGSYPLLAWSEVVLKHQTRLASPEERLSGATYHKCLHFVRSHLRHYQDGRVTTIPAHWRGDPALGIKRTRYRLEAA